MPRALIRSWWIFLRCAAPFSFRLASAQSARYTQGTAKVGSSSVTLAGAVLSVALGGSAAEYRFTEVCEFTHFSVDEVCEFFAEGMLWQRSTIGALIGTVICSVATVFTRRPEWYVIYCENVTTNCRGLRGCATSAGELRYGHDGRFLRRSVRVQRIRRSYRPCIPIH